MKRQKKSSATLYTSQHESPPNDSDEPLFFYTPHTTHGEFSTDDTEAEENIAFNCAEQFMMHCKASRFHERETKRLVLASTSPKEQERLGKLTAGFTDARWDKGKSAVVVAGTIAKFGQNPKLRGKLLATGDRLLVEVVSRDRIWGIGYTAKHAMSQRQHWGENRLGKALMEAREHLW